MSDLSQTLAELRKLAKAATGDDMNAWAELQYAFGSSTILALLDVVGAAQALDNAVRDDLYANEDDEAQCRERRDRLWDSHRGFNDALSRLSDLAGKP